MQLTGNILIVGDSYCYFRADEQRHWPRRLANNLNLNLLGEGFPGQGWWPVRQFLLEYSKTSEFNNTELFVICHTCPTRALTSNLNFVENYERANDAYYRYIYSDDVSSWAVTNWYNELNQLLDGKTVIHLMCFDHPEFFSLNGIKITPTLLNISIVSNGGNLKLRHWGPKSVHHGMSTTDNHFTHSTNFRFGDFLTDVISKKTHVSLAPNKTIDKAELNRFRQLHKLQVLG